MLYRDGKKETLFIDVCGDEFDRLMERKKRGPTNKLQARRSLGAQGKSEAQSQLNSMSSDLQRNPEGVVDTPAENILTQRYKSC